jgi:hypothetical protein
MSNNLLEVKKFAVVDPLVDGNNRSVSTVIIGGTQFTSTTFTASSASNRNAQFKIDPPNPYDYTDRRVLMRQPVTIEFVGLAQPGTRLLQTGHDAVRAYPLTGSMASLRVRINNSQFDSAPFQYIKELTRFGAPKLVSDRDFSTTGSMLDNCQEYADVSNTNRNPLAPWADNPYETPRGGAVLFTAYNNPVNAGQEPAELTATVSFTVTEPLFLSPLKPGLKKSQGFFDVDNMDVTVGFVNDLGGKMWSHSDASGNTITSYTTTLGVPQLQVFHITPKLGDEKPYDGSVYQVDDIHVYTTTVAGPIQPNASVSTASGIIQRSSVPARMYVFVREKEADKTISRTDAYFGINSISIQFGNKNGILAGASPEQLYSISARNGYIGSYQEWSGQPKVQWVGGDETVIPGVGSILCIEFGTDIGLPTDVAPGVAGKFQLNYTVNVTNHNQTRAINPELYTIVVTDNALNIINTTSVVQNSIVSSMDAMNALIQDPKNPKAMARMSYDLYHPDIFGGGFFGDLWAKIKKVKPLEWVWKGLKAVLPAASQFILPGSGTVVTKGMEGLEGLWKKRKTTPKKAAAKKAALKPAPAKGGAVVAGRRARRMRGGRLMQTRDYRRY